MTLQIAVIAYFAISTFLIVGCARKQAMPSQEVALVTLSVRDSLRDQNEMEEVAHAIESRTHSLKGINQIFSDTRPGETVLSYFYLPGTSQLDAENDLDSLIRMMHSEQLLVGVQTEIR